MGKPLKFGYEGEGPMLGRRTAYCSYPGVDIGSVFERATDHIVDAVYFVVDGDPAGFVDSLLRADLKAVRVVTLDFPVRWFYYFDRVKYSIQFLLCDMYTPLVDLPPLALSRPHTYVKIVCERADDFPLFVEKANEIANLGHTVLLMPDFELENPAKLGQRMMDVFNVLHPNVRIMPPVHHVLGMP